MRHLLLSLLAVATSVLMADAAISADDAPPVFNEDGSISDPNDHTSDEVVQFLRDYVQDNYVSRSVPSPLDAPYYMNLINNGADSPRWIPLYYNESEGCYMCDIPVLGCEWKIYSKEYFETTSSAVTNTYGAPASRMLLRGPAEAHITWMKSARWHIPEPTVMYRFRMAVPTKTVCTITVLLNSGLTIAAATGMGNS